MTRSGKPTRLIVDDNDCFSRGFTVALVAQNHAIFFLEILRDFVYFS